MYGNEPIRVLQSVPAMNHGGLEHFIMNVYRAIDRDKIQFDFLFRVNKGCVFDEEIYDLGGRIFRFESPDKHPLKSKKYYESFFVAHPEYKIIHSHVSDLGGFQNLLRVARSKGVPTSIIHAHSTRAPKKGSKVQSFINEKLMQRNKRNIEKIGTDFFACSNEAALWMFPESILSGDKFRVIANGIDVDHFSYNKDARLQVRESLNIPKDALVIGHVGRFAQVKNHKFLVDVFNFLTHLNPNSFLLLVGGGELKQQIQERTENAGISEKVRFLGEKEDTAPYYSAMDVLCMPSLYEGMPIVGIEAQANNLPILFSSNVPIEARIGNRVHFLDLEMGVESWTERIMAIAHRVDDNSNKEKLDKAGFNSAFASAELEKFYLEHC